MNKIVLNVIEMKKIVKTILVTYLAVFALNISAQQSEVKALADKMFTSVVNKDFNALLEVTHPKVFDIVPKEQMLVVFKTMFEGSGDFSIELPDTKPDYKLTETFKGKENNLEYAFLSYDMKMKMTFNNQTFEDDGKDMMVKMMKAQGIDVKFISNNTLDATITNSLVIILKEEATNNEWKMVNYDADSPLFYQVISSELLEVAKDYNQNLMLEHKKKEETTN